MKAIHNQNIWAKDIYFGKMGPMWTDKSLGNRISQTSIVWKILH